MTSPISIRLNVPGSDFGTIKHGRDFPLQKDTVLAVCQVALFGQIEWYHGSNFASIDSNVYRGFIFYLKRNGENHEGSN